MSIVNVNALKSNGCQLWWTGQVASANAPKAITANGDVKQILPFPGAGIGMFDGTGDYIDVTYNSDFVFGSSDFQIDVWVCRIGSGDGCIFRMPNATSCSPVSVVIASGKLTTLMSTDGSTWVNGANYLWSTTLSLNTWYHVRVVRSGSNFYGYLNGVQDWSYTGALTLYTSEYNLKIGGYPSEYYFNGYLSEYRVKIGSSTVGSFTPPKRQLESDSNTLLLLHFNRNDTTFIDSSPSAHTITTYGDAKQLCSPCGSGVAYFDGIGDYLTTPNSADFALGLSDFTISLWVYITNISKDNFFIIRLNSDGNANILVAQRSGGYFQAYLRNESGLTTYSSVNGGSASVNTWYHIAYVRKSGVFALFVNGVRIATSTNNVNQANSGTLMYIGTNTTTSISAYLSDLVFVKGTALYDPNIESFTPPTTPFKPDPYTKLLLHMDGVGNAFYDSSDPPGDNGFPILPDGVTITPNGTFTTQKMKDGRNVWKFDGGTNYIAISDHASWSMFLNNFTIAAWIKFDSIAANRTIIGQYTDANNQWFVRWTTGNVIQLYGITSSTARFDFTCPLTPVAGTWYHVVVQRSGSSCIMYINGVAQTVTQSAAFSATATNIAAVLSIGNIYSEYQAGNTKDLQIFTKALTMDQVSALYQETYIY